MKTHPGSIAVIFLILMITGSCDIIGTGDTPPTPVKLNFKAAEIIEADQQFAFDLFSEVNALSEEENIMISPLSVSYALGMTYNGAAGTTQDAFEEVLHFQGLTKQEVNESYKDLMGQLVTLDKQVEFSIANSIWYRLGASVLDSFINTNREYFDAAVEELDFSDPASVDVINDWIEEKTNDKIRDMLDQIPPGVYMYLVNAIYFNAEWKYTFDKDDTFTGDFHLEGGGTEAVDYMKIEQSFGYALQEDYAAVELPYGDSAFSMVAILPSEEIPFDSFIVMYGQEEWSRLGSLSGTQKMIVELPKFKYEFKSLLNDPLTGLGLGVAFSDAADFSGITTETDLYISRVIHQTFIDVNEKGTEAAAATIVEMRETSALMNYIRFDRPFVYIIKENSTGAILFMGKVGRPVYE
jgi:serpin B